MAGYLYKNVCYATQLDARLEYYTAIPPWQSEISGNSYHWRYENINQSVFLARYTCLASGSSPTCTRATTTITTNLVEFPTCEVTNDPTANFILGTELGTAVVTAIVTAVVIRRMWRGN